MTDDSSSVSRAEDSPPGSGSASSLRSPLKEDIRRMLEPHLGPWKRSGLVYDDIVRQAIPAFLYGPTFSSEWRSTIEELKYPLVSEILGEEGFRLSRFGY